MKKEFLLTGLLLFSQFILSDSYAQTSSASNTLVAQPVSDRTVYFDLSDTGVSKSITWGLDLAWLDEGNIRRGVTFMGADRVDIVRLSFTPTDSLVDGDLKPTELAELNQRLVITDLLGPSTVVMLNDDNPTVADWYKGNATHWAQLIDVTTKRVEEYGRKVVSVAPFNEPDNTSTGQGSMPDFYNIAEELRKNARFDSIRISGGNTLNTDRALTWYNYLKGRLDEGNTHQLAGTFDNYATFFKTVRANGDHATNDELHNVMEAMVGVEYGMQTGIWWGTTEFARGEFVKASDGKRLGYAEHRPNWTSASVYRGPDGKVQAFGGASERQAATTTYRFVSKDRDVYYDGYGPQREYTLEMPGGAGYQTEQPNAERVINITWGDDIQPVINGKYLLVNRNSGKVMEVAGGSTTDGAQIQQATNVGATYQQWNVTPVNSRIGGDFSYFTFTAVHSGKALDDYNWSLDNGGMIDAWESYQNSVQQWFIEYAEDGWFYIRNRFSGKCLDVYNASIADEASIVQWEKNEASNQQWRFLPVDATVELTPPAAPVNLIATCNAESVLLNWSVNSESDLAGYDVYRADTSGGSFNTIARNITTTSFLDNTTTLAGTYFYKVKAVDYSLNHSGYSNEASATTTGDSALVVHLSFDGVTQDSSVNLNHGAPYGKISYVEGKIGAKAIALNDTDAFVQLPATVVNQQEISIATWINWQGGGTEWQRVFDFGNNETETMSLSINPVDGKIYFVIQYGDKLQSLNGPVLSSGKWSHIAITLGTSKANMYLDGEKVAESNSITVKPLYFKPVLNYIGRSQAFDTICNGYIDDFRVYNYALPDEDVARLAGIKPLAVDYFSKTNFSIWPVPANDVLHVNISKAINKYPTSITIFDMDGQKVVNEDCSTLPAEIQVSNIPAGVYLLKLVNNEETLVKKLIVKH